MTLRLLLLLLLPLCACAPGGRATRLAPPAAAAPAPRAPQREQLSALQQQVTEALERKDWAQARTGALQLTAEEPNSGLAWRALGLAHVALRELPQAQAAFERSVALEDAHRTRDNLGMVLAMQGHVDQALPHFERAVQLNPGYGLSWLSLGKARLELGQRAEAQDALTRAVQLLPENAEARVMLAAAQPQPGEPPQAALEHHARGGLLASAGRGPEAETQYRAALALAPGFADCHYNLGRLARSRGDLDAAEREYRAAIAGYGPREMVLRADAQNNLADLLASRGRGGAEAVQLVREAIVVRGERASYLDTLARACDAAGDRGCAAEAFGKLLQSEAPLPAEVRAHAQERLRALAP